MTPCYVAHTVVYTEVMAKGSLFVNDVSQQSASRMCASGHGAARHKTPNPPNTLVLESPAVSVQQPAIVLYDRQRADSFYGAARNLENIGSGQCVIAWNFALRTRLDEP